MSGPFHKHHGHGGCGYPIHVHTWGGPPQYGHLVLPPCPPPIHPPLVAPSGPTDHNKQIEAQHKSTGGATPQLERPPETLQFLDERVGRFVQRTFRVQNGLLQELVTDPSNPGGPRIWVNASTNANPNGQVRALYFADGRLYDANGVCLGQFGINSEAGASLSGRSFLNTYGSLRTTSGQNQFYSGLTLSLEGQPSVIVLGPPPGLVPVLKSSTQNILVNSKCGTHYWQVNGDKGYEKHWVRPDSAEVSKTPQYTHAEIMKLPTHKDGWRYTPDGRMRFNVKGGETLAAEVRLHLPTNLQSHTGLCMASAGWAKAPEVIKADPLPPIPKSSTEHAGPIPVEKGSSKKGPPPDLLPVKKGGPPEPMPTKKGPVVVVAPPPVEKLPVVEKAVLPDKPPVVKKVVPVDEPPPMVQPKPQPVIVTTDMHADAVFTLWLAGRQLDDVSADIGRGVAADTKQKLRLMPEQMLMSEEAVTSMTGAELPRDTLNNFITRHGLGGWAIGGGGVQPGGMGGMPGGGGAVKLPQVDGIKPGGGLGVGPADEAAAAVVSDVLNVETVVKSTVDTTLRGLEKNMKGAGPLAYFQAARSLLVVNQQMALGQYEAIADRYAAPPARDALMRRLRAYYNGRPPPGGMANDYWDNALDELEHDLVRRWNEQNGLAPPVRKGPQKFKAMPGQHAGLFTGDLRFRT